MNARINREARALVEYAEQHGFTVVRHTKHIVMRRKDGAQITIPSTPSEYRGLLNKKAEIRRLAKVKDEQK